MKIVISKNCNKKVGATAQRKVMAEIGRNAFASKQPKVSVEIERAKPKRVVQAQGK